MSTPAFLRTPRPDDAALGALASIVAAVYAVVAVQQERPIDWVYAALSFCFAATIFLWRSRPRASAVAFLSLLAGWSICFLLALPDNSGYPPWAATAPMAVFATARTEAAAAWSWGVLTVSMCGSFLSPFMWTWDDTLHMHYRSGMDCAGTLVTHWLILGFAFLSGSYFRSQDKERVLRAQARENQLRNAREEERLHIAREIHDALAHSLTLIKLQAEAGLITATADPESARASLKHVRDSAAHALNDVRGIVDMLREDPLEPQFVNSAEASEDRPAHTPGARLTDLPGGIDKFRDAGLTIDASLPDNLPRLTRTVSAATQHAIDRLVTEALNNVVRHQGLGSSVTLTLTFTEDQAVICVESSPSGNDVPGAQDGTGTGLVGIEERVRALGGDFSAHPGPHGMFLVTARLPLRSHTERE